MFTSTPLILALIAPTIFAVKYAVQFVKPLLDVALAKTTEPVHTTLTRIFAVLLGAGGLPGLAYITAPTFHTTLPLTLAGIGTAAVFGAGAGLAAIGDYHLLDALEAGGVSALEGISGYVAPLAPVPASLAGVTITSTEPAPTPVESAPVA